MLESNMVNFVSLAKHPAILKLSQHTLYQALKLPGFCSAFNVFYQRASASQQRLLHAAFAKIFRDHPAIKGLPPWKAHFAGQDYQIPLNPSQLWLHWDTALSLNGHDTEVKLTYHYIWQQYRPQVFFDVGANYGTHSLLLAKAGLRVVAFEPNPRCHEYFWQLMDANRCLPTLVKQGVGARKDTLTLSYDPRETWNGQLGNRDTPTGQNPHKDWIHQEVEVTPLDDYIAENGLTPDLMKIDTEGFEQFVFEGASALLARQQTFIIFESLRQPENSSRPQIFEMLKRHHYAIHPLPWQGEQENALSQADFVRSTETNFIALPHHLLTKATAPLC